jgi:putative ABC transport system substrate-binding protein
VVSLLRRRELILCIAGVIAADAARAQQKAMPVIGFLHGAKAGQIADQLAAFHAGLRESGGFVEGQNVAIEYRWADNRNERQPALAADLVGREIEVIATAGGDRSAIAAKHATSTIPIVSVIGGDPVAEGLVASLAHPGANLTGVAFLTASLTTKRLELLLDLVPRTKIVALLVNPSNPQTRSVVDEVRRAALAKGVELQSLEAGNEGEIDEAFLAMDRIRAGALVIEADAFFNAVRGRFVALAAQHGIAAIHENRAYVAEGGLISYGTSLTDVYRQVGVTVGKVMKGAKPAELPVEQPTTFDLAINLKTAKALGLTVPPLLLARADEVIE